MSRLSRPARGFFGGEDVAETARELRREADRRQCHRSDHPGACLAGVTAERLDDLPVTQPLACTRGCNHCCRGWITATPGEAVAAARYAVAVLPDEVLNRIDLALGERVARLESLSAEFDGDAEQMGEKYRLLDRPCPFLAPDRGECLIYDARPLQCRAQHSLNLEACIAERTAVIGGSPPKDIPEDPSFASGAARLIEAYYRVWEMTISVVGRKRKKGQLWNRWCFLPMVRKELTRARVLRGK